MSPGALGKVKKIGEVKSDRTGFTTKIGSGILLSVLAICGGISCLEVTQIDAYF